MSFSDISTTNWAYTAASHCARYGIIDVYSGTTFGASNGMTRGMFMNALYHLAGEPEISAADIANTSRAFTDFSTSLQYSNAFVWAYINGILMGNTSSTISPNKTITRQEAVTFMYRYGYELVDYELEDDSGPYSFEFDDYDDLDTWAEDAMDWATQHYIINGTGNNMLKPKTTMTKAQCASMIYKFTNLAIYPG